MNQPSDFSPLNGNFHLYILYLQESATQASNLFHPLHYKKLYKFNQSQMSKHLPLHFSASSSSMIDYIFNNWINIWQIKYGQEEIRSDLYEES